MHTTIAAAAVWQFVLLWGPLVVGAPVRPNMLNMHKYASGAVTFVHKSLTCNNNIVNFAVRHGVFFGRMFNVQFCSDLFGVSLYNSKIDKKQVWNIF